MTVERLLELMRLYAEGSDWEVSDDIERDALDTLKRFVEWCVHLSEH